MKSLTQKRRIYKRFRDATALPDPMRSECDYLRLVNRDLCNMDPPRLRRERDRARFMFMLQADDAIIAISPDGKLVTAKAWLEKRLAAIDKALGGWADGFTAG